VGWFYAGILIMNFLVNTIAIAHDTFVAIRRKVRMIRRFYATKKYLRVKKFSSTKILPLE
jgi:hypothetical protein